MRAFLLPTLAIRNTLWYKARMQVSASRAWAVVMVVVALVTDWMLTDYLLRAPVGVFVYLPLAVVITWPSFILARALWWAKRPRSATTFRSGAIECAVQAGLLLLSIGCIIAVPATYGQVSYALCHRDPIGIGSDVDRPPCETRELALRDNGHGVVASVRQTMCSGNWDPILMYFVFVHRSGEPNTRENLVFRYEDYVGPDIPPPAVSWMAATNLRIEAHGYILLITKRRVRAGNVSITYRVQPKFALQ